MKQMAKTVGFVREKKSKISKDEGKDQEPFLELVMSATVFIWHAE